MTHQKLFSYFLLAAATFIFFYVIWNEVVSVWTGVLTQHQIVTILLVGLFVTYVWFRVLNQLKQIRKGNINGNHWKQ
jgi:hypothetical protein